MKIVDAQIHLWNGQEAPPHHWRAPFLIDDALRAMDEAGIDRAVNHPAVWDAGSNAYAVEAARLHPDRFATLGWFPLTAHADEALVDRWLEMPGMLGLRFMLATPEGCEMFQNGSIDWIFEAASRRKIPLGVMLPPSSFPRLGVVAARNPDARLLIDHLGVSPFAKLPDALAHMDDLVRLAALPNVAVKATATPSMSNEAYPFADTFEPLRTIFDAYGPDRFFWGSDYTRMRCSWRECATMFTDHLEWLRGTDKTRVMGQGMCDWIGWT